MIDKNNYYVLYGFKTSRGTFTLVGSSREYDEFKHLETCTYHKWKRKQIKEWCDQGKITPIPESTSITWFL